MNPLPKSLPRPVIPLLATLACILAAGAFATLWTRQQISRTADRIQSLETQYQDTRRKLNYLEERIAALHRPARLRGSVSGALRRAQGGQIVWVREQPAEEGRAYAEVDPFRQSMDLALLETESAR